MKLNTKKVEIWLQENDRNLSWLAKKIGTSRQLIAYWLKSRSVVGVEPIALALQMDAKKLIDWTGYNRR